MSELGFGNKSDFDVKIASLGPLLVCFLVEIWSDKSLIWGFLNPIFCLAALVSGPFTVIIVCGLVPFTAITIRCELFLSNAVG